MCAGFRLPDEIAAGVADKRWRVVDVSTDAANFQNLRLKRVDAVVADSFVGQYLLNSLGMDDIRRLDPPLMGFPTYIVFKKSAGSAALAAGFDRALQRTGEDGTIERLTANYVAVRAARR